ncbi:hypothetical protein HMI56_002250 [Coelomomyces lativittatus]|nr:hypothetical protein HMI56_002250 [Coelomomyces lativittatus]
MTAKEESMSELILSVAKLRSHNIVLKKAFQEEQKAHQQCEMRFREQEVLTNVANEKIDTLQLFNTRLTRRIDLLQSEIVNLKNEKKASWWPITKSSKACNSDEHKDLEQRLEASIEELQSKILENETLQTRLYESNYDEENHGSNLKEEICNLQEELENSKVTIQNLRANLENRQRLYDELTLMHSKYDALQLEFDEKKNEFEKIITVQNENTKTWKTLLKEIWFQEDYLKIRASLELDIQYRLQHLGASFFKKYTEILGYNISYLDSKQTEHLLELFDIVSSRPEPHINLNYLERVLQSYIAVVKKEKENPEVFQLCLKNLKEEKLDESIIMSTIQHFSARSQLWAKSKKFLQKHMHEFNSILNEISALVVFPVHIS